TAADAAALRGGTRREKNPWSDLGRKLYEMRDKLKNGEDGMEDPEVQALWLEAIEIARKLAEELGIDLQEFELSPYTLPMIMLAMLDASDLPPEGAQSAALDALVEAAEGDWKTFMADRAGLTKLEARLEMVKMTGAMFDGVWGSMTPDQRAIFDKVDMLARDRWAQPNSIINGGRQEVSRSVLASWTNDLGLSEAQSLAVKPVVDDYVRRYSELQADFARRAAAGTPPGPTEKALATTGLMVDAQKQLSKTVTLDDAQQEKLKSWGVIYGVGVEGE
ncbi:MAG: hypothetical protein HUU15_15485, partial [Candidatus Brocadiae bacterium]|nr:hypothetical protein [Candidatus Brocadiia bacterium]